MNEVMDAGYVTVTNEAEYLLVGFADDEYETKESLIFMRSHEYDEQDVALGMNQVYIERNDQGHSAYGGIQTFILLRNRARLCFDETTAHQLGITPRFEIRFAMNDTEFDDLKQGLRSLFEGTSLLQERTT